MPDLAGPANFFGGSMLPKSERYANPFYGIPLQYLPQNMDHMLWWADHFLLRFGFYRAVLSRIANYFITELSIECDDSEVKKKYTESLEMLHWKQILSQGGLNLLAYGNIFASINRGFTRMLSCPKCKKIYNIEKLDQYNFDGKTGIFSMTCQNPKCRCKANFEIVDKPSNDVKKISVNFWNPREIRMRYEQATGASEYFWDIPPSYIKLVTKQNNKFYSKKTPKVIFDAIIQKRLLAFNEKNFVHLRVPMPVGIKTDGKSIPFCIYLFDDFFMLKVLQRFNESICFEDIAPFRVIAMSSDTNPAANPILTQNAEQWRSAVQKMVSDHRKDPGGYHTFPFPLAYEQLGGQGKNLAPVELINQAITSILNSLSIPQELYTMTLQAQALGPALRLFENSWSFLTDVYNELLQKVVDVIGSIQGLPEAKVSLMRVTLSDDVERKGIISQLVATNSIARSEMLKLFNFDFKEQVRKKLEEDRTTQELQREEQVRQQLQDANDYGGSGSASSSSTPSDTLDKAQQIAEQLFQQPQEQRRQELQKIKAQDETLWSAVKGKLEEMTQQAKSQGLQQAKGGGGQQQQGQGQQ